jgi:hypothetical protein
VEHRHFSSVVNDSFGSIYDIDAIAATAQNIDHTSRIAAFCWAALVNASGNFLSEAAAKLNRQFRQL